MATPMCRYVALAWQEHDRPSRLAAHSVEQRLLEDAGQWSRALSTTGLIVLVRRNRAEPVRAAAWGTARFAIIGDLFRYERDHALVHREAGMDEPSAREVVETDGRCLISNYWGTYVLVMNQPVQGCRVLRDPAGALPCYWAQTGGLTLAFSHIEDVAGTKEFPLSINIDFVRAYLAYSRLRVRATGFREVAELQPGECLSVAGRRARLSTYWDPKAFALERTGAEAAHARAALRDTGRQCIAAWGAKYRRVVHQLSGGLDSAIVLGCLRRMKMATDIVALNFVTATPDGDERALAAKAASRAGVRLVERHISGGVVTVESAAHFTRLPRPSTHLLISEIESLRHEVAVHERADAVFSGFGGDNLFFNTRTTLAAADALYERSLRVAALRTIREGALLSGESIWRTAGDAIRYGLFRRRRPPLREAFTRPGFLAKDALAATQFAEVVAPSILEGDGVPNGKLRQIAAILDCHNFYEPFETGESAALVHPLLSQPLIELCLQIPTYILAHGGHPRALARVAFADDLPPEIAQRLTKGAGSGYRSGLIEALRAPLRHYLLGGLLAESGLLDLESLDRALAPTSAPSRHWQIIKLLECLNAEAWLRAWTPVTKARV
jgi:asparagine synthase (glutamine-hydrolysing)